MYPSLRSILFVSLIFATVSVGAVPASPTTAPIDGYFADHFRRATAPASQCSTTQYMYGLDNTPATYMQPLCRVLNDFNVWARTGNTGTDPLINFLGTIDNKDLVIKTNSIERIRVSGTNGRTQVNQAFIINNGAPTLVFKDTNQSGSVLYSDGNKFYIASTSGPDSETATSPLLNVDLLNGSINMSGQLISTVQNPTPAFQIASNVKITNLNADYIDGIDSPILAKGGATSTTNNIPKFTSTTNNIGPSTIYDDGTNVGIGTSTPAYKLEVSGGNMGITDAFGVIRKFNNTPADWPGLIFARGRGSVGAPTTSLNGDKLGAIAFTPYNGIGYPASSEIGAVQSGDSYTTGTPSDLYFTTVQGGTPIERMRITSSGNIGIGTTTPDPDRKLHIVFSNPNSDGKNGKLVIENTANTINATSAMQFRTANSDAPQGLQFATNSGNWLQFNSFGYSNNPVYGGYFFNIANNATTAMVINKDTGNVGIGTVTPIEKLDVTGNIRTSGNIMAFSDIVGYSNVQVRNARSFIAYNGSNNAFGSIYNSAGSGESNLTFNGGATTAMVLTNSGVIGIGTSSPDPDRKVHIVFSNPNSDGKNGKLVIENTANTINATSAMQFRTANSDAPQGLQFATNSGNWLQFNSFGYSNNPVYGGYFFNIANNATTAMVINKDTGNVGIGTTTPQRKLHIIGPDGALPTMPTWSPKIGLIVENSLNSAMAIAGGASNLVGLQFLKNGGAAWSGYIGYDNLTDKMTLAVSGGGSEDKEVNIDNAGSVGIGTRSPGAKLEVNGTANIASTLSLKGQYTDFHDLNPSLRVVTGPGTMTIGDDDNVALSNGQMYVKNNGNVGIGTTTPLTKLDVVGGAIRTDNTLFANQIYATMTNTGGLLGNIQLRGYNPSSSKPNLTNWTLWNMQSYDGTSGLNIYQYYDTNGNSINCDSSGTDICQSRFFIRDDGNVGIGTVTPGAKLEVNGSVKITDGTQGANKVLTSDASGLATWQNQQPTTNFPTDVWVTSTPDGANRLYFASGGRTYYGSKNGYEWRGSLDTNIGSLDNAGNLTINGDFRFTQANPYINASSYFLAPGGAYFNSSPVYTEAAIRARGGIQNDTASYLSLLGGTGGVTFVAGSMGIGTTTPGSKLDVAGNILLSAANPTIGFNIGGSSISQPLANTLTLNTSGLERVRIDTTGNVGIGTTSPGTKLDVAGDLTVQGKLIVDKLVNRTVTNVSISGSLLPDASAPMTYRDIGSNGQKWNDLYLAGNISAGGTITAPTFVGNLSGNATYAATSGNAAMLNGYSASNFVIHDTAQAPYGIATNSVNSAYSSAIQIRESNLAGAGAGTINEAPHLAFHWSGRVASQIMMPSDGSIQIRNNPGTGYETLKAGPIYSNDSAVWTQASLTNLSQLTNGPGYITDGNTNWDNSYGYITSTNPYYNVTAGDGNGICFWQDCTNYKISMGAGGLYQYGPVTDYSIKMQMDAGSTGRGFTWGRQGAAPIAGLNATSGNFQTAGSITAPNFVGNLSGNASSANSVPWTGVTGTPTTTLGYASDAMNTTTVQTLANGATKYFTSNKGAGSYVKDNNTYGLEAYSTDGGAAGLSFHRGGYYAVNMGLDPDDAIRIGGWSDMGITPGNTRMTLTKNGDLTIPGAMKFTSGGGWFMVDSDWIRSAGGKNIYQDTGIMRTDGELQVGGGGSTFDVPNGGNLSYRSGVLFANTTGNVGIGTTSPGTKLDVAGDLTVQGKLIVDKLVNRTVSNVSISGSLLPDASAPMTYRDIGSDGQKWNNLYLAGQVKIAGGSPGANKVLTSDASGLATWQSPSSASTFPNDAWLTSTSDGANRFHFTTGGRTYFGSQNGYEWRSNTDAMISTLDNAGNLTTQGTLTVKNGLDVSNAGGTYTYITLHDDQSPGGVKYIHADSNVIGFLGGGGVSWLSYWDNAGNQNNIGSITAGGNITAPNFVGNLSGNANSATYATTAGSANTVAWTNISGKPDFTAGRAYPRRADGADMNFNYIGQPGQPTWLWGSTDGNNMYVWNPSNFSVNYANTAGGVAWTGVSGKPTTALGYASDAMDLTTSQTLASGIVKYFTSNKGASSSIVNTSSYNLEAYSDDNGPAGMSFHRSGRFAVNIGLDPDDAFRIGGWSAGGTMLTIDKNGNMTNPGNVTAGGGFFYASDKRLKTHIVPLDNSLEKILSLSGYTFDWKSTNKPDIGVIAQEVEKVFPDIVHTNPETGFKSVEYGNLVAPLIESIKAQQKEIESLREEVKTLKSSIH